MMLRVDCRANLGTNNLIYRILFLEIAWTYLQETLFHEGECKCTIFNTYTHEFGGISPNISVLDAILDVQSISFFKTLMGWPLTDSIHSLNSP